MSVAERALGLAAATAQDMTQAGRHLRTAIAAARRAGAAQRVAEAQMSLAGVLAQTGRGAAARRHIDASIEALAGADRARALMQRGAIQQHLGHPEAALSDYEEALPHLRGAEHDVWRQRLLMNRGLVRLATHDHAGAAADLQGAERICRERGFDTAAAMVHQNLVSLYRLMGDVPSALEHLAESERLARRIGAPLGPLLWERAHLLLALQLHGQARAAAQRSVAEHLRAGCPLYATEARLLLATASAPVDPAGAAEQARAARRELGRQQRPQLRVLADYLVVASEQALPGARPVRVARLRDLAAALDAAGWDLAAADCRLALAGALTSARASERTEARAELARVAALRSARTTAQRLRGWSAEAILRQAQGRPGAADRAALAGLGVLHRHRSTLAATDLRARVAPLGRDLVAIGLGNAVRSGSAWRVLTWTERSRARHLLGGVVQPPADPELARLLGSLRATVAELTQARGEGYETVALARRQTQLEVAIAERTWRRRSGAGPDRMATLDRERLHAALGDAELLEFVAFEGRLAVVQIARGRARLAPLGPLVAVEEALTWLPFALDRVARTPARAPSFGGARTLLARCLGALQELLLPAGLVAPEPAAGASRAGRPLVLVPTGALAAVPWPMLAGLRGRPVTVAPSAQLWLELCERRARPGPVVVVAGPGLPGARREAHDVADAHGCGHCSAPEPRWPPPARLSASRDCCTCRHTVVCARTARSSPACTSPTGR